ncbi:uncharacterized protein ATNIH1004_008720 [Aspergillus tanneri]|uniref:Uncharacterized protein n=1 Tax=Aspergillus tanneri TaxID=1220188 RepID=A0A5M9MFI2_9EURO|nr:uncharacterized protein ATNIH1004_008720 [Aspergillus tanneri]KAA8644516.1 hypothetical protein ATNIH1004_008720 [Aspergillus tanneri]
MLIAIFAFGVSFSTWFFISTQVCVNLLGYTTVLTAVFFLGEEHPGRGSIYTTTGPVAWAFATPDRAGGTGHGEGYWCALLATIIFVVGSLVTLVPTQSILRQMEWGNHAVAGALFNTAYQGGASVVVTFDGYRNAFWLLAWAAVVVAASYWPKPGDRSVRLAEEAQPEDME